MNWARLTSLDSSYKFKPIKALPARVKISDLYRFVCRLDDILRSAQAFAVVAAWLYVLCHSEAFIDPYQRMSAFRLLRSHDRIHRINWLTALGR